MGRFDREVGRVSLRVYGLRDDVAVDEALDPVVPHVRAVVSGHVPEFESRNDPSVLEIEFVGDERDLGAGPRSGEEVRGSRRAHGPRFPRPSRDTARQFGAHAQPPSHRHPVLPALRLAARATLLSVAQRVLAIPVKRVDRPVLGYLSREEVTAIIDAPDRSTWSGQRDAVLFAVLYNTGARVSEITRLHVGDVLLDRASSLLLHGKGRKERVVPLWKSTAAQLRRWLPRIAGNSDAPVFPNRAGKPLSRSGVEHQLRVACRKASLGGRPNPASMSSWSYCRAAFGWRRGGNRPTMAVRSLRR